LTLTSTLPGGQAPTSTGAATRLLKEPRGCGTSWYGPGALLAASEGTSLGTSCAPPATACP
jgi:hypothetical protein